MSCHSSLYVKVQVIKTKCDDDLLHNLRAFHRGAFQRSHKCVFCNYLIRGPYSYWVIYSRACVWDHHTHVPYIWFIPLSLSWHLTGICSVCVCMCVSVPRIPAQCAFSLQHWIPSLFIQTGLCCLQVYMYSWCPPIDLQLHRLRSHVSAALTPDRNDLRMVFDFMRIGEGLYSSKPRKVAKIIHFIPCLIIISF